jgi:large subunit ribosomal protein L32
MAVPKGKISKSRGRMRRANWKLTAPAIVKCPRCQQMMLAHRVCKKCGYYDGKQVVVIEEKKVEAKA